VVFPPLSAATLLFAYFAQAPPLDDVRHRPGLEADLSSSQLIAATGAHPLRKNLRA